MKSLRFVLSLDGGIKAEQEVIDHLKAYPSGRRQNKIRELLLLGVVASRNGRQPYDRTQYSGYEPQSHRITAYLRDDAPDDEAILAAIKDVPRPYQPVRLKEALVLGHVIATTDQSLARPAVSLARLAADPSLAPDQDVGVQSHRSSSTTDSSAWTAAPPLQGRARLESQSVGQVGDADTVIHSRTANAPSSAKLMTNPSAGESGGGSLSKVNDIDEGERTLSLKQAIQGLFQ